MVLRCFLASEAYQEGQGRSLQGKCWLPRWASCGPAWAGWPSWHLGRASDLAGLGEAVASGGALEGREEAADGESCLGGWLLQVGAGQGPLHADVPVQGSGCAAAVPFAVVHVTLHILAVPCESSVFQ